MQGRCRAQALSAAVIEEDVLRYQFVKKKGYVRLHTNKGDLNLELHCDLVSVVAVPRWVLEPCGSPALDVELWLVAYKRSSQLHLRTKRAPTSSLGSLYQHTSLAAWEVYVQILG